MFKLESPLLRQVLVLASGSAVAQLINLATAPFIARIYGPEAVGLQGVFTMLVGLGATVAALSYPSAIVLPSRPTESQTIAWLSLSLAVVFAGIVSMAILIGGPALLAILHAESLPYLALFLPVAVITAVALITAVQLLVRESEFRLISLAATGIALTAAGGKIGFALVSTSPTVLIICNLVAASLGTAYLMVCWNRRTRVRPRKYTLERLRFTAVKYRSFALLRTPQELLNTASLALPVLFISAAYGAHEAGLYSIAFLAATSPATVFGNAASSVVYARAAANPESIHALIVSCARGLTCYAALPLWVLLAAGPEIFALAFGDSWRRAGVYAQLMTPLGLTQLVSRPFVAVVPIIGGHGLLLSSEILSFALRFIGLAGGYLIFRDDAISIAGLSVAGSITYILVATSIYGRTKDVRKSPGLSEQRLRPMEQNGIPTLRAKGPLE